jgi:hypothetical protein
MSHTRSTSFDEARGARPRFLLRLIGVLRRLVREPRLLFPVFEHFVVFSADPRAIEPAAETPHVLFRALTDAEVASLE